MGANINLRILSFKPHRFLLPNSLRADVGIRDLLDDLIGRSVVDNHLDRVLGGIARAIAEHHHIERHLEQAARARVEINISYGYLTKVRVASCIHSTPNVSTLKNNYSEIFNLIIF